MEKQWICLCVLAVFVVITAAIVLMKKKKQTVDVELAEKTVKEIKKDIETKDKTKETTIIYSEGFTKTIEDKREQVKDHVIKSIIVHKAVGEIWICPNCEVENVVSDSKCCVCHYDRENIVDSYI